MTRVIIAMAFLAACGGGPSVPGGDGDGSTQIVSTNCQILGSTSITVDVSFTASLGVGQRWESVVQVGANSMISEDNFFSCNAWTPTGFGSSAKGCQRDTPDQPANQSVNHTYNASFQDPLITPVQVSIIANTFVSDSEGGFSIGNDFDDIDCF